MSASHPKLTLELQRLGQLQSVIHLQALALPILQREISGERASMPLFEAATILAHPSLAADLRAFAKPSGDDFLDGLALRALKACEGGAGEGRKCPRWVDSGHLPGG